MVLVGLLELALPFLSAPGVEEFHTTPEFHVNGSGMGLEFSGTGAVLARAKYHFQPRALLFSKRVFVVRGRSAVPHKVQRQV
jgi:hypothetical protein